MVFVYVLVQLFSVLTSAQGKLSISFMLKSSRSKLHRHEIQCTYDLLAFYGGVLGNAA